MEINENKLRFSGTLNLPKGIEIDKVYSMTVSDVDCTESRDISNNDGSLNRVFKLVLSEMSQVVLISEKGALNASKKGSQSQVVRWIDNQIADEQGMDRETHYKMYMDNEIKRKKEELENLKFEHIKE